MGSTESSPQSKLLLLANKEWKIVHEKLNQLNKIRERHFQTTTYIYSTKCMTQRDFTFCYKNTKFAEWKPNIGHNDSQSLLSGDGDDVDKNTKIVQYLNKQRHKISAVCGSIVSGYYVSKMDDYTKFDLLINAFLHKTTGDLNNNNKNDNLGEQQQRLVNMNCNVANPRIITTISLYYFEEEKMNKFVVNRVAIELQKRYKEYWWMCHNLKYGLEQNYCPNRSKCGVRMLTIVEYGNDMDGFVLYQKSCQNCGYCTNYDDR